MMVRFPGILSLAVVLGALGACGDDDAGNGSAGDGDSGVGDGDGDDTGDGDGDGDDQGSQSGGKCAKGDYPSDGTVSFCSDCDPLSGAKDYTDFYGDIYVTGETDLSPLECLESAGSLSFFAMPAMESLAALKNMTDVGSLLVKDSPKFKSLAGIEPDQVGSIHVVNCGVEAFEDVPEGVTLNAIGLSSNANLTSLAGLEKFAIKGSIILRSNPKLPECEAKAFAARYPDAKATISGNDTTATCD